MTHQAHFRLRPRCLRPGPMAALLALVVVAAGCTRATPTPGPKAEYDRYCAVCHGADGLSQTGTNSPQLNNATFLASASDEYLFANIARGRPGTKMSSFGAAEGGPLSDATIRAIIEHIRTWGRESPVSLPALPAGDASAGAAIYAASCAECHGPEGTSDVTPDLANPVFQDTASDAFIATAILEGRPGTAMQPWALSPQETSDVIAFVRTLHVEATP